MPTNNPDTKQRRQEWQTPADLWTVLDAEFNFGLDAAASEANSLCTDFLSLEDDALMQPWTQEHLTVYCNPGFSKMLPWVRKAYQEAHRRPGAVVVVMALIAPSTRWWGDWAEKAAEIRLLSPRVEFAPPPGIEPSRNARENCLIIFRDSSTTVDSPLMWTWEWRARKRTA